MTRRPERLRATVTTAVLAALALGSAASVGAQSSAAFVPEPARDEAFELSIRKIMRGPENVGQAPSRVRWTDDSQWVYFSWRPGGAEWDAERSTWRARADGTRLEELTDEEAREAAPLTAGGDLSSDRLRRVSSVEGDLWLIDRQAMQARRLTDTEERETQPLFSGDGTAVIYRRGNNLFRLGIDAGEVEQLTRIAEGPAPSEEQEPEGHEAFLEQQQLELFDHVRREEAEREEEEAEREAREADEPETVYLERNERVASLDSTRDGEFVLVRTFKPVQDATRTMVPDWVTAEGYTDDLNVRTKVGDEQSTSRFGLLTTESGEIAWIDPAPDDHDSEHPASVASAGWNDAGTTAFVFTTSFDDKDRWLWSVDAASGERTLLDHLHDDAWVDGPCFARCVGFVPGADRVWFVSEESGYAHLYAVGADGTGKRALTSGEWEVLSVTIPESRDHFLMETNEGSPFDQHVYRMGLDGSDRTALTEGDGRYQATPSPDGNRFAILHDVANRPPELYLAEADDVSGMERVTNSPTEEWASFPWLRPEIIRFEADDGTRVPARIYRPSDMDAEANGAGVIFVHGAGYLHNVHDYWSSYYREYQFNHLLAAAGYTVLDIDYRGSAGYGAEWRTAIYRWMGGKDLSDQVEGAEYLVAEEGVDPERIGIYGGSYGGFITLMALFTAPDTFKSGAALRSVTDWAQYNHPYTSRILNLPHEDDEAYERSSPIYFAENFRPDQHLVMLHGMVDTNVHFSDVVRLSQRLIELGKTNWELAVYPVEGHGFVEPASWTDEYRRIFELFERTLREPGCTAGGGACAVRMGGG